MQPYADLGDQQIFQGHALEMLTSMADESVHAVVTSPPYWGLRDYKIPPVIWDDPGNCQHDWTTGDKLRYPNTGQFCQLCPAWRGSLGLEPTPELFVQHLVQIFREVRRVLRKDGTLWCNLGDSYAGSGKGPDDNKSDIREYVSPPFTGDGLKPKDLIGIPWRVAFALQADGWWLRQDIIWSKSNPMPESVTDRCTKAHEYIFLLAKSARYYFDNVVIRTPVAKSTIDRYQYFHSADQDRNYPIGQQNHLDAWKNNSAKTAESIAVGVNKRSVWTVASEPLPDWLGGNHYATYPPDLIRPCILAGCPEGGLVLDPFCGTGTTLLVARQEGRRGIGIELSERYCKMVVKRLEAQPVRMSGL